MTQTAHTLIAYDTTEGQTWKIAQHMGDVASRSGHDAQVIDIRRPPSDFTLDEYDAILVGGSIHLGKHSRHLSAFVRRHKARLEALPTAFFSVSLSAAGTEKQKADADRCLGEFLQQADWSPTIKTTIAGGLAYRKYGFLKRWIMKRIARNAGGDTDTSKNHEYTDWQAVDQFVQEFLVRYEKSLETSGMLKTIYHELGHASYEMMTGLLPAQFEIECDITGEHFGDATPQGGAVARNLIVSLAYVGPLAEVRYRAGGRKIDKSRSAESLVTIMDYALDVSIWFDGQDAPDVFPKEIFGTDWAVAARTAREARNEIPDLDVHQALVDCMGDAIDFVNDDQVWAGLATIAVELAARDELKNLKRGESVDLRDIVVELIRRHIPLDQQGNHA